MIEFKNIFKTKKQKEREEYEKEKSEPLINRTEIVEILPKYVSHLKRDLEPFLSDDLDKVKLLEVVDEYRDILAGGKIKDDLNGSMLLLAESYLKSSKYSDRQELIQSIVNLNNEIHSLYSKLNNKDSNLESVVQSLSISTNKIVDEWKNIDNLSEKKYQPNNPNNGNTNIEKNIVMDKLLYNLRIWGPSSDDFLNYLKDSETINLITREEFVKSEKIQKHVEESLFYNLRVFGPSSDDFLNYLKAVKDLGITTEKEFMKIDKVIELIEKKLTYNLRVWGPGSNDYKDYLNAVQKLGYRK